MAEDDELAVIRRRKMLNMMRQAVEKRVTEPLADGRVHHLTDSTFWSTIGRTRNALIDFFGEHCAPCRTLAPMIEEMAREFEGRVFFGKVDVNTNLRTATQMQVYAVPTVIVFRNSRPVTALQGLRPLAEYYSVLEQLTSQKG
ncbi:MAG: thioredoxin domain-containing protein [Candidatus Thorarchaeota archaeon]